MEVVLLEKAKKDRDYWKQTGNEKIMNRITDEHRMIYSISSGRIYVYVFSLKGHYQ